MAAPVAALGPAVQATFFGVPSLAQRFAFVLDMSGSMVVGRWSACVRQLAGALEGLTEGLYYELKPLNIELRLIERGGSMALRNAVPIEEYLAKIASNFA